jgi:site-specific recombinase XerD
VSRCLAASGLQIGLQNRLLICGFLHLTRPQTWLQFLGRGGVSARSWSTSSGSGGPARTRNARLTAIRALFRFAALRHPEHAELIARVSAIPAKRFDRALVSFLTLEEIEALLAFTSSIRHTAGTCLETRQLAAATGPC